MALEHAHFQFSQRATARQHTSHEPCECVHPLANTRNYDDIVNRVHSIHARKATQCHPVLCTHFLFFCSFFPRVCSYQTTAPSAAAAARNYFNKRKISLLFNVNNKIRGSDCWFALVGTKHMTKPTKWHTLDKRGDDGTSFVIGLHSTITTNLIR